MAQIPESIQKIVEDYTRKISTKIPVKKAILFGSYVKGTYDKNSDIDLAIFSDYFAGMEGVDAFKFLFMETLDYNVDLEPLAFTLEEYEERLGIVDDIIKTGIEITIN